MKATSRISLALAAAAALCAAAAVCVTSFAARCYRAGASWLSEGFDAIVLKIKPAEPDANFLHAWHRVAVKFGAQPSMVCEKRRPLVSPRWRLCPSI